MTKKIIDDMLKQTRIDLKETIADIREREKEESMIPYTKGYFQGYIDALKIVRQELYPLKPKEGRG